MKINKLIYLFIIILILILIFHNLYSNLPPFPIDVVYTWAGDGTNNNIRLDNNNELKYSLRSVLKYAPWVNHIYIYMNPPKKKPEWFNDSYSKNITIYDHNDTILKNYLPNTNSNAIETTISGLPNLNEHFIYFNDDMFLTKYCNWTDFFSYNGKPYVDQRINEGSTMNKNNKYNFIEYPEFTANAFYRQEHIRGWLHIPLPRLKSQMIAFEDKYADYIEWVRNTKNRSGVGCEPCLYFALECPCQQQHNLIGYFMYKNKKAVLKNYNIKNLCVQTGLAELYNYETREYILNNLGKYLCVNDSVKLNNKKIMQKRVTYDFYEKLYPEKPHFET